MATTYILFNMVGENFCFFFMSQIKCCGDIYIERTILCNHHVSCLLMFPSFDLLPVGKSTGANLSPVNSRMNKIKESNHVRLLCHKHLAIPIVLTLSIKCCQDPLRNNSSTAQVGLID